MLNRLLWSGSPSGSVAAAASLTVGTGVFSLAFLSSPLAHMLNRLFLAAGSTSFSAIGGSCNDPSTDSWRDAGPPSVRVCTGVTSLDPALSSFAALHMPNLLFLSSFTGSGSGTGCCAASSSSANASALPSSSSPVCSTWLPAAVPVKLLWSEAPSEIIASTYPFAEF